MGTYAFALMEFLEIHGLVKRQIELIWGYMKRYTEAM